MQITFKPIVIQGGARKGGDYPVYIRVYFAGKARRLPTTITCTQGDLTRSGRIKSPAILAQGEDLIRRMRTALGPLTYFEMEAMDVDMVVERIRKAMSADAFQLDLFTFSEEFLLGMAPRTAQSYRSALGALERYLGARRLNVNDITRAMLQGFGDFVDAEPKMTRQPGGLRASGKAKKPGKARALYLIKLAAIFEAAKARHNDEDAGVIVIPRNPFAGVPRRLPPSEGQRPLDPETMQALIDHAAGATGQEGTAFAAFIVSFMTMGANMADLFEAPAFAGDVWVYRRKKTRTRRPDGAEVRVQLPPQIRPWLERLKGAQRRWWLPALHGWRSADVATSCVGRFLRIWAQREGLPPLTFYAARKTWATTARALGVEKATIDEALGHVGDFRMADIYAARNWQLAWDANAKVLRQFKWPEVLEK